VEEIGLDPVDFLTGNLTEGTEEVHEKRNLVRKLFG
jgi:hypothetical protein